MDDILFELESNFEPTGDQPEAIEKLVQGLKENKKYHPVCSQCVPLQSDSHISADLPA